ncbi:MAG: Gfo/Idh/MocA family oxidoreductase [Candidatus Hydrogenedentota bacterium]
MDRKVRMGMVGGGYGAFIGAVHRIAGRLDGCIELVCGAFDVDPNRAKEFGKEVFLPADRVYGAYEEMIEAEAKLPEGERMDFVSVVTPNKVHHPVAMKALSNGFHVACEKPMTVTLQEAKEIEQKVKETGLLLLLTHTYTGYPMVKHARKMVQEGQLGKIRRIVVEYPQGWMAKRTEDEGCQQASWRVDPAQAGGSFTMGDVGTHAANLAETISGLKITDMCADLHTYVPGRKLDDDGNILLKFEDGATGLLWASGVAIGEENGLNIRIYGEKGGLTWRQEEPNTLVAAWLDKPKQVLRTGIDEATGTRVPPGHPEGYLEAFANLYVNFARAIDDAKAGKPASPESHDFTSAREGVRGMAFVEGAVESSKKQSWIKFPV